MEKLTILHLSDLHWSPARAVDQKIVISALLNDLEGLKSHPLRPDLIVFSGDLVQAGDNLDSFASVNEAFLMPVRAKFPGTPLVIVPGNHDIAREVVRASNGFIDTGLKASLKDVDRLNKFIDDVYMRKSAAETALERLSNYEAGIAGFGLPTPTFETRLLRTFTFSLPIGKVGVAAFNTAWLATGEPDNRDRNALLLGERNVDMAVEMLSGSVVKVAVFHHPTDWLADFDNISVSSRLFSEFDLLMFGHVHSAEPGLRTTPQGNAILSQAGCLYDHRDYFNGYHFITLFPERHEAEFVIRTYYNKPRRAFDRAVNVVKDGCLTIAYEPSANSPNPVVETFLRGARPTIRQLASEHFNIVSTVSELALDPKEAFICPPLSLVQTQAALLQETAATDANDITADKILKCADNFLISGARESGKSSLAHYFAVLAAEGVIDRPRIPAVLDFRHLKLNTYGLGRSISSYFGASKQGLDIEARLAAGDFLLIVDNAPTSNVQHVKNLTDLQEKFSDARWILLADVETNAALPKLHSEIFKNFRRATIQTLPRKSIRELARRWCDQAGADGQKTFSTVMEHLQRSNLPRTGYIVTLLLWALYQDQKFERVNEAFLLSSIIDHLLGKADFTQALSGVFDPRAKEIVLQFLASAIRKHDGIIRKNEALKYLINFFDKKGLTYDADKILAALVDCGILIDSSGLVAFKYRCFEEYFVACFLHADANELAQALSKRQFVIFDREIELLSGLRRENKELIEVLTREIGLGAPVEIATRSLDKFDAIVEEASQIGLTQARLNSIKRSKLTFDQIDDLMDRADRELVRYRTPGRGRRQVVSPDQDLAAEKINLSQSSEAPMTSSVFVEAVFLLARVLRNSEFTDAPVKLTAAKIQLRSSLHVALHLIEILSGIVKEIATNQDAGKISLSPDDAKGVTYLLTKLVVLMFSLWISTTVATEKLFSTFEAMLADEESSLAERIFVAMILLDLSHPRWINYWDQLIDEAKGKRFLLDILVDRLNYHVHTRGLSTTERKRVGAAVEKIERCLGLSKDKTGKVIQHIQNVSRRVTRQTKG